MEESDSKNICRACLVEEGEFQSVFVPHRKSGLSIHISEMLSSCASLQITLGDGLPEQICSSCARTTVDMYLFKLTCEKSDIYLRKRLQNSNNICKLPLVESNTDENTVEPIKPESPEMKISKDEILLQEFDNFNVDTCKSDEEYFPELVGEEELQSALKQQNKPNLINKFECDICEKKFTRLDLLMRHKIAHAMKVGDNIEFDGTFQLGENDDNLMKIKSEDFMFSCSDCGVMFINKEDLENHVSQEHEKKEQELICHMCPKRFTKVSHLNRHVKTHNTEKLFKCSQCDKTFARQEQLSHHMNVHTGIKPHTCDICFKGFNQISNLKDHMRTHNGDRPFLCSTCGKGFNQLGNLRQHTIRHTGIKAHLCSTCGNGFASKGELSAHLRKHTGARPFVCPICGHGFTTSSSLTKHKRIHSGEKPYECDVCKMKFSRSGILARHKRTHTGEKPYVCKFCSKAFSQSNDLTSHLRIHTGEKPYICDECGQAFRQSSALKTHKKTHIDKNIIIDTKPILINNVAHETFFTTFQ